MRAFTLLELLVVMLLMALAFGLLAPRLGRFASPRKATFPESVRMLLEHARTAALTRHEAQLVVIEPEERKFLWVKVPFDPDSPQILESLSIPEEIEVKVARVIKVGDLPAVLFLVDGTSSGGEIELINRDKGQRELLLIPQGLFFIGRKSLES